MFFGIGIKTKQRQRTFINKPFLIPCFIYQQILIIVLGKDVVKSVLKILW